LLVFQKAQASWDANMQLFSYQTNSLADASSVMAREWSRHDISSPDRDIHMRFRRRTISPDVSLNSLAYGAGIKIKPIERDPVILVFMPRCGDAVARFRATEVAINARSHAIVDVRRISEAVYSDDFDMLVLRVRISRLAKHLETILGRKPRHDLEFVQSVKAGSLAWQEWAVISHLLAALDASENPKISPHVLAPLEEAILSALLVTQTSNYAEELNHPGRSLAPKHVRKAESYIRENVGKSLTVAKVAEQLGVSVRSLFDGFKAFRGVTPGEFMRSLRLEGAREDLLSGRGTVTDIALKWGYANVGNFAARYRQQYGELPALTLRFGESKTRRAD
jgi:AraC-like DNA-binding protein